MSISRKKKLAELRIAQWGGKQIIYLPLYIAADTGFFADHGVAAEIYHAGNDDEVFQEVETGRADIGIGDPTFVAIAAERGVRTQVIAALINNPSLWGVTTHPEIRPMEEAFDFVGLRFGTYPQPSTAYAILADLRTKFGRSARSMEIIESEIGRQFELLARGEADVIFDIEPMISLAEESGMRVVLSAAHFYKDFLFTGAYASEQTIADRAEQVQILVSGVQHGLNVCRSNTQLALDVAQTLFPAIQRPVLERAVARMRDSRAWPDQTLISAASWRAALQLRERIGNLRSLTNTAQLCNQQFAYRAVAGHSG